MNLPILFLTIVLFGGVCQCKPHSKPAAPALTRDACLVYVHGKGDRGAQAELLSNDQTVLFLRPQAPERAWGGYYWNYTTPTGFRGARDIIADALTRAHCQRAVLHGFSNGASLVAKLYCAGDTFDGRIVGYVIDDPVPDHGAQNCSARSRAPARLYWTGALSQATPQWQCQSQDWTCEGGSTIGIDAYAAQLALPVTASPHRDHRPVSQSEALGPWLNGAAATP